MSVPMILYGKYKGVDADGRVRFDITIRFPEVQEGVAFVKDVCQEDLMSGKQFTAEFNQFGSPDAVRIKLGPSPQQVRASVTRQERVVAEALGGHRQTGSGARPRHKGDGRVEGKFRIENKMTRALSTRVELSDLRKIRSECAPGEVPVFEVEFRDKHTLRAIEKWALVPWREWETRANAASDDQ